MLRRKGSVCTVVNRDAVPYAVCNTTYTGSSCLAAYAEFGSRATWDTGLIANATHPLYGGPEVYAAHGAFHDNIVRSRTLRSCGSSPGSTSVSYACSAFPLPRTRVPPGWRKRATLPEGGGRAGQPKVVLPRRARCLEGWVLTCSARPPDRLI